MPQKAFDLDEVSIITSTIPGAYKPVSAGNVLPTTHHVSIGWVFFAAVFDTIYSVVFLGLLDGEYASILGLEVLRKVPMMCRLHIYAEAFGMEAVGLGRCAGSAVSRLARESSWDANVWAFEGDIRDNLIFVVFVLGVLAWVWNKHVR